MLLLNFPKMPKVYLAELPLNKFANFIVGVKQVTICLLGHFTEWWFVNRRILLPWSYCSNVLYRIVVLGAYITDVCASLVVFYDYAYVKRQKRHHCFFSVSYHLPVGWVCNWLIAHPTMLDNGARGVEQVLINIVFEEKADNSRNLFVFANLLSNIAYN